MLFAVDMRSVVDVPDHYTTAAALDVVIGAASLQVAVASVEDVGAESHDADLAKLTPGPYILAGSSQACDPKNNKHQLRKVHTTHPDE